MRRVSGRFVVVVVGGGVRGGGGHADCCFLLVLIVCCRVLLRLTSILGAGLVLFGLFARLFFACL